MVFSRLIRSVLCLSFLTITMGAGAQAVDTASSDGLLQAARQAAFDHKNYELARHYLYRALAKSPGYADIKIFLGRIHTWTDNADSARYYFTTVLKTDPTYVDASLAYSDLEYWNNENTKALAIIDSALVFQPLSEELLIRRAKILNAMRQYESANTAVQKVLSINKRNSQALALANSIRELATRNKIGISYEYVYFDKQFSDPWQLAGIDYTRNTSLGSITGRLNYANRFKESGVQYEVDAYPRISKTFYSYISAGYSDKVGVFPKWRAGFSLYANLPASFEADLGIRYLQFSGDPTYIYTAALGKYIGSWLLNFRSYVTPNAFASGVSASYNFSARYYYGSADDFWGLNLGYGLSPDDRQNAIQLDNPIRLISYKAGLSFRKKVSRFSVLSLDGSWFNQEYLPATKGNQYQFGLGWLFRF